MWFAEISRATTRGLVLVYLPSLHVRCPHETEIKLILQTKYQVPTFWHSGNRKIRCPPTSTKIPSISIYRLYSIHYIMSPPPRNSTTTLDVVLKPYIPLLLTLLATQNTTLPPPHHTPHTTLHTSPTHITTPASSLSPPCPSPPCRPGTARTPSSSPRPAPAVVPPR